MDPKRESWSIQIRFASSTSSVADGGLLTHFPKTVLSEKKFNISARERAIISALDSGESGSKPQRELRPGINSEPLTPDKSGKPARRVAQITTGAGSLGNGSARARNTAKQTSSRGGGGGESWNCAPLAGNDGLHERWEGDEEGEDRGKNGSKSGIRAFFASGYSLSPRVSLDVISWARATRTELSSY